MKPCPVCGHAHAPSPPSIRAFSGWFLGGLLPVPLLMTANLVVPLPASVGPFVILGGAVLGWILSYCRERRFDRDHP